MVPALEKEIAGPIQSYCLGSELFGSPKATVEAAGPRQCLFPSPWWGPSRQLWSAHAAAEAMKGGTSSHPGTDWQLVATCWPQCSPSSTAPSPQPHAVPASPNLISPARCQCHWQSDCNVPSTEGTAWPSSWGIWPHSFSCSLFSWNFGQHAELAPTPASSPLKQGYEICRPPFSCFGMCWWKELDELKYYETFK